MLYENVACGPAISACTKECNIQLAVGSGLHNLFCGELCWSVSKQDGSKESATKSVGVTRIHVCEHDTSGSSHCVSKLTQVKIRFEVMLRLQESLTYGRLPQEGCTWLHKNSRQYVFWHKDIAIRWTFIKIAPFGV